MHVGTHTAYDTRTEEVAKNRLAARNSGSKIRIYPLI